MNLQKRIHSTKAKKVLSFPRHLSPSIPRKGETSFHPFLLHVYVLFYIRLNFSFVHLQQYLTAEYLTSIPQMLRHFVFFSRFILPAMRSFTL